ncbi:hypothetical protein Tco_1023094 [Tanacetum coccineum]
MPIFKRTFSQDLDLLEQHPTKDILSQTNCKTILTKVRTTFENAFNSKFKERIQMYTRFNAQSFQDAMICNMDSIGKYMPEIILHQQRTPQLLKQKKLMQTQEDHSNLILALNVDSSKVVLSKEDLKGTHIEHGFKRAFMSLFGQDVLLFTSTILLNVDQLQKQLDKDEFQEDGSMAAFGGQHGQILNETSNKAKIKKEINVLEIMNIELEHNVAKLHKENETLKKRYKDLYDSIKITRPNTIEQTTSLLANNGDLKARIQEMVFAIAALKNDLRKSKGNTVILNVLKPSVLE